MALTGRFTFRRTWRGRIVLQVEEEVKGWSQARRRRWRDATMVDLAQPEMRSLIDLRHRPHFMPQTYYAPAEARGHGGVDDIVSVPLYDEPVVRR
ncbi:MAG TPA: hypothetical protein VEA41_05410 [Salinarimonas sp.]|nr:hypothetical protein [Salinarimonas sp.]